MKKRTGRPLIGTEPRVRVFAHVAAATDDQLRVWRAEAHADDPRAKLGQVIDRLVQHGLASRWNPRTTGVRWALSDADIARHNEKQGKAEVAP